YALFGAIYLFLLYRVRPTYRRLFAIAFYANMAFLVVASLWFEPWYALGPLLLAAVTGDRHIEFEAILFSFGAMAVYVADLTVFYSNGHPANPAALEFVGV